MFTRVVHSAVMPCLLLVAACGGVGEHARPSAVHDGMRALGLVQMPAGTYEFRLCEIAESYTPEVLAEKCINPLVGSDGVPMDFSEIPDRPGTLAARSGNWTQLVLVSAAAGLAAYVIGRYFVKLESAGRLSRKAYVEGLERSLEASRKYDHFVLPKSIKDRLLKEKDVVDYVEGVEDGVKEATAVKTEKKEVLRFDEELRELLMQKRLRKNLGKDEEREISELLLELEEKLVSGSAYTDTLKQGLEMMDSDVLHNSNHLKKIVHEHEGKLSLNDHIEQSLRRNIEISNEDHRKALRELDGQVAIVLNREAKGITSRVREVERLQAAAGLDKVLRLIEGNDAAITAAQHGDEKLRVLTLDGLQSRVEELKKLVDDSSKGGEAIKGELESMSEEIKDALKLWEEQDDSAVNNEVVAGMAEYVETARKQVLKDWRKRVKEADKELQETFKKPAYVNGAAAYEEKAYAAIRLTDSVRTDPLVVKAGNEIERRVGEIIVDWKKKTPEIEYKENEVIDGEDLLIGKLGEVSRRVNLFEDLKDDALRTVSNSSLMQRLKKSMDETKHAELMGEIKEEIDKIVKEGKEEADSAKVIGFFARLREFKFKDIFSYWDKNADRKLAPRIKDEDEVVARLANDEAIGEVKIEKGVDKLLGHITAAATFATVSVTSLREKLSGHARVSASSRWGELVGSYELNAEGRVDDIRTIIDGIAAATGAKVSDEVFYFMLRSGLNNKR